jgi:hypothetical protein
VRPARHVCRRDDSGLIGLYVSVLFLAFVLITGLIIDGGAVRSGRREAGDLAAQAARAGSQEIDLELLRSTGRIQLEPQAAAERASGVLAAAGRTGSVSVGPDRVTVTVSWLVPMRVLGLAGVGDTTISATRVARPAEGVVAG